MISDVLGRRLIVCAGAGGVGKTTVSAALALRLAREGARTVVVTIDPARRLAAALGMAGGLADEARRVPADDVLGPRGGELWALQLDARATFDRLVARYAPDDAAKERILDNRIYRHLSGTVAGAQEYMAVERLHELVDQGGFDRIVLDTPPAANALDFLEAPARITRFIEGRALRLLLRPGSAGGGLGWKLLHAGSGTVISLLERLTGAQLLRDVGDFLAAFEGMYSGFAERAKEVRALLSSDDAAFVVVAAPESEPLAQALELAGRLQDEHLPFIGVVLNRVHPLPPGGLPRADEVEAALAGAGDGAGDLAERVVATLAEEQVLGLRDLDAREFLRAALHGGQVVEVPAFAREPVELAGLAEVAAALGA